MLRTKPGDGEEMYQVIYKTYINPDYKDVLDLFDKLSLSRRRYYYLRENAFMLMSLILWAYKRDFQMAGDHFDAGGNEDGLKALCESSVKRVGKSLHKIGND